MHPALLCMLIIISGIILALTIMYIRFLLKEIEVLKTEVFMLRQIVIFNRTERSEESKQ